MPRSKRSLNVDDDKTANLVRRVWLISAAVSSCNDISIDE